MTIVACSWKSSSSLPEKGREWTHSTSCNGTSRRQIDATMMDQEEALGGRLIANSTAKCIIAGTTGVSLRQPYRVTAGPVTPPLMVTTDPVMSSGASTKDPTTPSMSSTAKCNIVGTNGARLLQHVETRMGSVTTVTSLGWRD